MHQSAPKSTLTRPAKSDSTPRLPHLHSFSSVPEDVTRWSSVLCCSILLFQILWSWLSRLFKGKVYAFKKNPPCPGIMSSVQESLNKYLWVSSNYLSKKLLRTRNLFFFFFNKYAFVLLLKRLFLIYLLILGVLGLSCCSSFSLVALSRSQSLPAACRLLLAVASLPKSRALEHVGFCSCDSQALGHRPSSCDAWT